MASAEGEEGAARPPAATRPKLDRRAEALRANLNRRKAQTRARDEARVDDPRTSPDPDAPGRDG